MKQRLLPPPPIGPGLLVVLGWVPLLASPAPLSAVDDGGGLIAYEGFDYEVDTSIEFQNGGFGWAAAWNFRQNVLGGGAGGPIMNSAIVMPGSLTYDGLQTSGNHVRLYGDFGELQLARRLAEELPSEPGTSLYISFLGQRVGPPADPDDTVLYPEGYPWGDNLYPRGAAFRFFNNANSERLSAGMFSNRIHGNWMLYGQGLDDPTEVSFSEAVAFIVIRIDFNGGPETSDDIHMWVNPDLDQPEDTATADLAVLGPMNGQNPVHFSGLTVVSPYVGHASGNRPHAEMLLDELRIGRTWASVTPQEDPPAPQLVHDDANLIAYEGFEYVPGGSLTDGTLAGGFGWHGAWNVTNAQFMGAPTAIQDGSLQYVDMAGHRLHTTGNRGYGAGGNPDDPDGGFGFLFIARTLAQELSGEPGSVYYLSFLAQEVGPPLDPEDPMWDEYGGYPHGENLHPRSGSLRLLGPPDETQFGGSISTARIGRSNFHPERQPIADWTFRTGDTHVSTGVLMHERVHLVVVRIQRNVVESSVTDGSGNPVALGDRVTMWLNPKLAEELDDDGLTFDVIDRNDPYHIPVGRIGFEAGSHSPIRPESRLTFDEIRVGTTYASVTPHYTGMPADPILVHPEDVTAAAGQDAVFTVEVTEGEGRAFRWQASYDGGLTYSNISDGALYSGSQTDTLTVREVSAVVGGVRFRVEVTEGAAAFASQSALLTVVYPVAPVFTAHPVPTAVTEGGAATFSVQVTGEPEPEIRWQVSTDGGATFEGIAEGAPYSGVETATLVVSPAQLDMSGLRFRAKAWNVAGEQVSHPAVLTVNPPPSVPEFSSHPQDRAVPVGSPVVFAASASGFPVPAFQWQVSFDGGVSFGNITDDSFGGGVFSGTLTSKLTVLETLPLLDGALFRVRALNTEGTSFSDPGGLSVLVPVSFDDWVDSVGVPVGHREPGDRNGPLALPNLAAYGMGLSPLEAGTDDLPKAVRSAESPGELHFHYRVNTMVEGATIVVEKSTDLGDWGPAVPSRTEVVWDGDGVEGRVAVFHLGEAGVYLRLRVDLGADGGPASTVPAQ